MNILVFRFSALGDVAISVPVIKSLLVQNDDINIYIATREQYKVLFPKHQAIRFIDVDFKNEHKGILGLYKLAKYIRNNYQIDAIADIHDVLRTKILRLFLLDKKKAVIDKGKKEKKLAIRRKNKKLKPLKTSIERYVDVFGKLGIIVKPEYYSFECDFQSNIDDFLPPETKKLIGMAPFAAFDRKMYPIEKMEKVVDKLSELGYYVIIFGGGRKEREIAEKWEIRYKNIKSAIGKFSMPDEICLMKKCRLMLTMDSGNMHLAALAGTKIVSIWGATHPYLGFSPFAKDVTYIQRNDLNCRPCSVFGKKECYKKTLECFDITPQEIVSSVVTEAG